MKNNETGRSMVEMLGVLAIIGVLSAGGLAGYSKAMFKHKLNNTMDQITMLVTNIRTMYGTQGNYSGLNNGTAVNLGIVPAVMDNGSGSGANRGLTNPFKGDVNITTAPLNTVADGQFILSYASLPKEACIALATADFGSGAGSGFLGVAIGASATQPVTAEGEAYTIGGTHDALAASGGCTESATIKWFFY